MSGGSKTQTTTQTQQPYAGAKPLLDRAMGDAMANYNMSQLDSGAEINTAVPFSELSNAGMRGLHATSAGAAQWDPVGNSFGNFANTYGSGGYNDAQRGSLGQMQALAGGSGYNDQQRTAMAPMEATARGDFLNRADPNFEAVLARTKENAGTDVGQMMSGMGRFAGGAHQGILTDRLGGIESDARLGQYNMERDRQTDAANSLFGMGQTGMGNRTGAINNVFGMGQTGMGNVGQIGDIWSSMQSSRDQPYDSMLKVGGLQEGYNAAQVNDQLRRSNAPMTSLQALLGMAQGAGQYGTATAQTPQQNNTMSNLMGGGLGLASLLFGG